MDIFAVLEFFFNTNERRKMMLLIAHYGENVEMEWRAQDRTQIWGSLKHAKRIWNFLASYFSPGTIKIE